MNIFNFRDALTKDYAEYVRSFIRVGTDDVRATVDAALDEQVLWPEPIVQLNPAYAPGGYVRDLVGKGLLHATAAKVFQRGKDRSPTQLGTDLRLYRHQVAAIETARSGRPLVVTSGTGSGKSLTYIIPIVDHVLRNGSGRGVQAIIVYPMNALANSQLGELDKFLGFGFDGKPPVRVARYTGQESHDDRRAIVENPPDILLTNYVMLELILTRRHEQGLVRAAKDLRYLVFDELHTYRGRQGADVAMLVRRVRERMGGDALQCIGTSATMSSSGGIAERRRAVADVASRIFGVTVQPDDIIGETLQRVTADVDTTDPGLGARLRASLDRLDDLLAQPYEAFVQDPLCGWIETQVGVHRDPVEGVLVRSTPKRLVGDDGLAVDLARLTGIAEADAAAALRRVLLAGYGKRDPSPDGVGAPAFAFRLHQFLSRGEAVYASLRPPGERYVTMAALQRVPEKRDDVLLPLAFCRECGHEYYTVWRNEEDDGSIRYAPRMLNQMHSEESAEPAFLYLNETDPWPDRDEAAMLDRLPEEWLEEFHGEMRVARSRIKNLPHRIAVGADGVEHKDGLPLHVMLAPFRFCPNCSVYYPGRRNDFAKLGTLGAGGRATATTVLSLSAVQQLRASDLEEGARKLLSFTDNRQDASLQAGHFNDFVQTGMLRGALYKALSEAGPDGVPFVELPAAVVRALALDLRDFGQDPDWSPLRRNEAERSLRDVVAYRLALDLQRGWRITAPNLEQVGLMHVRYAYLDEVASDAAHWRGTHPALADATPEARRAVVQVLLDVLRRALALQTPVLAAETLEQVRNRSYNNLKEPWSLDPGERLIGQLLRGIGRVFRFGCHRTLDRIVARGFPNPLDGSGRQNPQWLDVESSESPVVAHQVAAMDQRADDMLFHHADGNAQPLRDLAMAAALDLVHDEGGLAGRGQLVEQDRQTDDPVPPVKDCGRILPRGMPIDLGEIDAVQPFAVAPGREIHGRRARGRERIGLRMLDGRRLRRTAGKAQIGVLHHFLAAVAIADQPRGITYQIAVMPPVQVAEPGVEASRHRQSPDRARRRCPHRFHGTSGSAVRGADIESATETRSAGNVRPKTCL